MQITEIETICLSRPHERERQWVTARYRTIKADCAIVVIHTDEGVDGIGEASPYGWPLLIREWVSWMAPDLIGQDPSSLSMAPHPNGLSRAHDAAVAGIDCALWDLRGKVMEKPVCELLVAQPAAQVRLYASGGCQYDWRRDPRQLVEEAVGYAEQGFSAFKFRLGTEWSWDEVTVDRFLGLARELAQEVDSRLELMVDGNCRLTEEQALAVGRELDKLGFAWFEEPIPGDQIEGYARLCEALATPVTGGESLTTLEQFRPYLQRGAYDIVQPDAGLCGISEAVRIAQAAQRYGVDLCPHSWHNGLMAVENGHLVAALSHPRMLELCMIQGPLQWEILAERPPIENGWLSLPQGAGLGVRLAEGLEARYPYVEGHYALQVTR